MNAVTSFLNNLDAKKVSDALQNTSGKITPLEGQNALMVYGNPETFKEIEKLVKSIDIQQQQIEIKSG